MATRQLLAELAGAYRRGGGPQVVFEKSAPRDSRINHGPSYGMQFFGRIAIDGSVPADNPFVGQAAVRPEIWSYGHRNVQSAAIHPVTGRLWTVEHGPRGGDEVNIPGKGLNYGWPVIGYGIDYSGLAIHETTHEPGMEQPVYYWRPSIAPSGMAFYTGQLFPKWRGNLFVGALAGQALHRLVLDDDKVVAEEILLKGQGRRIRDVRQGPDGALWLLTDDSPGEILRIAPGNSQ